MKDAALGGEFVLIFDEDERRGRWIEGHVLLSPVKIAPNASA
jgi:hypothetical protein